MITPREVEMIANLLQRAGVNPYEEVWANGIMDELRVLAAVAELERKAVQDASATKAQNETSA